jgi:hypothetical protein
MQKTLALVLTVCVGALAVGCEPEKKPAPNVPKSDLGAPAGKGDSAKPAPTSTTPPAEKKK